MFVLRVSTSPQTLAESCFIVDKQGNRSTTEAKTFFSESEAKKFHGDVLFFLKYREPDSISEDAISRIKQAKIVLKPEKIYAL